MLPVQPAAEVRQAGDDPGNRPATDYARRCRRADSQEPAPFKADPFAMPANPTRAVKDDRGPVGAAVQLPPPQPSNCHPASRPTAAALRSLPWRVRERVNRAQGSSMASRARNFRFKSWLRRKSRWASRPASASRSATPARCPLAKWKSAIWCPRGLGCWARRRRPAAARGAKSSGRWERSGPARKRPWRCN